MHLSKNLFLNTFANCREFKMIAKLLPWNLSVWDKQRFFGTQKWPRMFSFTGSTKLSLSSEAWDVCLHLLCLTSFKTFQNTHSKAPGYRFSGGTRNVLVFFPYCPEYFRILKWESTSFWKVWLMFLRETKAKTVAYKLDANERGNFNVV